MTTVAMTLQTHFRGPAGEGWCIDCDRSQAVAMTTRERTKGPSHAIGGHRREFPDRRASGKAARVQAPLDSHAGFTPASDRDPVGLLLTQAKSRVPELVPVRHARMLVSPFAFFRGAALPMAWPAIWALTPTSGLHAFSCAGTHTWRTSVDSHRRDAGWCSTSTTSMRRFPVPSSGT